MLVSSWPEHANLGKMKQLADQMTQKWVPTLEALTSDPGCYMNEVSSWSLASGPMAEHR